MHQKEGGTQKEGVPTLEETIPVFSYLQARPETLYTVSLFPLNQFKVTSHSDSKNPVSSWIIFPKQARVLSSAKLCLTWKTCKTSYTKWGIVLIPEEHLKWHLQGNFGYHLFWCIACFPIMSIFMLEFLCWNHKHQV